MKIQFNTDKTITGNERDQSYFTSMIADGLKNYESHITRIESHLSDENEKKDGQKDMRCLLEARIKGKPPVAVSCQANTIELAVSGAVDKLTALLKTTIGRMQNH